MATHQHRILTTHVGSLVRPPKLVPFLEEIEERRPYDESAHAACLTESIAEVVRQQAEAGVDIVSDGEFAKTGNWAWYIHQRISGFTERPATP
jgi:5-methyltetrahydropteroyltriglutamate--homocysteine methyltransferase